MTDYITGSGQTTNELILEGTGNTQLVSDGGVATSTYIEYGATQTVTAGGITFSTVIYPDSTQYVSGGLAVQTNVAYGATQMVMSGQADGTQVLSTGVQIVSPGATVTHTLVSNGGTQVLLPGATASDTIVQAGGSLDVRSIDVSHGTYTFDQATKTLSITDGGKQLSLQLGAGYVTDFIIGSDNQGGTLISTIAPQCFCRGTLITTRRGEVTVEDLDLDDEVLTRSGGFRQVRWLAKGKSIAGEGNRPILVRTDALQPGVPYRDVLITARHAVLAGDVLIPIEELENGTSILRDYSRKIIDFYHLEVASHDIVYANGLPAETFRDVGNRHLFDEAMGDPVRDGADRSCAPIVSSGPVVERARRRLKERAAQSTINHPLYAAVNS